MKSVIILLVAIIQLSYCSSDLDVDAIIENISKLSLSEDGKLNFTQLVDKYGHNAKQYEVVTEDGYILKVFRIPGKGSPVLMTHGLIANADPYVIRGHDSLGMALADAGYDVWLLNNRGTKHSRRHTELDPDKDKQFWDFSFHEMGVYDLAATIDFVCDRTSEKRILTIGHSQGGSQFFALMSLKPEYNDKVKLFIGLAPAAYFFNMPPFFRIFADVGPLLLDLLDTLGIQELFRDPGALLFLIRTICTKGIIGYEVCAQGLIFPLVGYNPAGLEVDFLNTLLGHVPSGISRKCLEHFDQLYLRKKFSQFDYGVLKNLGRYGSSSPPDYDLSKVTAKVALLSGELDKLVLPENVERLRKYLPNVVYYEKIKRTSHNDLVVSGEEPKYLFPSVLKLMKKYASINCNEIYKKIIS